MAKTYLIYFTFGLLIEIENKDIRGGCERVTQMNREGESQMTMAV